MVFVLLLVISVEIIGAIFIRELENTTINTFQINMNSQVEQLASNLSNELTSDTDDPDDLNLKRIISEFAKNDILEVRVVDDKGIVRATSEVTKQSDVGKKNDYNSLNDFSEKRTEITDPNTGERVYINVQQVKSTTGNAVIGAVYVKSNIEKNIKKLVKRP